LKTFWEEVMGFRSTESSFVGQTAAWLLVCALLALRTVPATADPPPPSKLRPGSLPAAWLTGGPKCMEMPEWQVHEYNPDFYLLRQSGCTDFEKPFLFLMFGGERALLLDTGSRNGNLAPQLKLTVHRWLLRNKRDAIPLTVVHTHSHGDHTAGDADLVALNDPAIPVTLIPATVEASKAVYGIARWPDDIGRIDLGARIIDAVPVPGHDVAGVALYDRQTGILFTGDNVYPGRLYIRDLAEYSKSNQRMLRFTEGKEVAHLLGNHIEATRTPYLDYAEGTMYQPDEHELALPRAILLEIQGGLDAMHGKPQRILFGDVSLVPYGPPWRGTESDLAAVKARKAEQAEHRWDQTQP